MTGSTFAGQLGFSVSGAGDTNGDGYADVIAGEPGLSTKNGSVSVFLGAAAGVSSTPSLVLGGPEYFGAAVADAGDVNGDGYADVIIGASSSITSSDSAYLYLGSASGLSSAPDASLSEEHDTAYGWAVAGAGDVDGDGYDDVVVGAFEYNASTGRVYLYRGSAEGLSTTASATLDGETAGDAFGMAVAGAGDVNGDGYDDVIVGAPLYGSVRGRSYLVAGSASGLASAATVTIDGPTSPSYAGVSVSGAGDINRDGYDDVIIGAPFASTYAGMAQVLFGSAAGLASTADTTLTGPASYTEFGYGVSGAGDLDADGYADLIVGAYGSGAFTGEAQVFAGGPSGVDTAVDTTLLGEFPDDFFGTVVSDAGDTNGDGYGDVVVSAFSYGGGYGRIYVYEGQASAAPDTGGDDSATPDSGPDSASPDTSGDDSAGTDSVTHDSGDGFGVPDDSAADSGASKNETSCGCAATATGAASWGWLAAAWIGTRRRRSGSASREPASSPGSQPM